jgi:zinc resistance-associated protein
MNRTVISAAALALVGAGVFAFAQTQTPPAAEPAPIALGMTGMAGMRASAEDRAVLLDARIGAVRAVLKLTPDQEKLWEPVEALIRKTAAARAQRAQEMRDRMAQPGDGSAPAYDPIARLRKQADRLTARAALMHEFADTAAPLYASLSEDQKRRALLLINRARDAMTGIDRRGMRRGGLVEPDMMDWRG